MSKLHEGRVGLIFFYFAERIRLALSLAITEFKDLRTSLFLKETVLSLAKLQNMISNFEFNTRSSALK